MISTNSTPSISDMDVISAEDRAKHVATFNTIQADDGYVTGTHIKHAYRHLFSSKSFLLSASLIDEQVREIFENSYLDEDTLGDIWCVSIVFVR
jgi:hypothetical protein